jgi:dihydropyrimidinase
MVLLYSEGVATGRLSLERLVDLFAATPAKLFGLYPRKGVIAPGSDADVVLFDPEGTTEISARTHHMNVDFSIYEGWVLRGSVRTVLAGGDIVIDRGRLRRDRVGQYLVRGPSGVHEQ